MFQVVANGSCWFAQVGHPNGDDPYGCAGYLTWDVIEGTEVVDTWYIYWKTPLSAGSIPGSPTSPSPNTPEGLGFQTTLPSPAESA